jgi:hypothetical protein
MPVGNRFDYLPAQPLAELHHSFLMAGGTKMTTLA